MSDDEIEEKIASIIKECVTIGYTLGPDGRVDPETIFVTARGAAHMVHHFVRQQLCQTI